MLKDRIEVPSEYGYATVIGPDAGNRPEPTDAERQTERSADRIGFDELLKSLHLTDGDLDRLQSGFSFPKSPGFRMRGFVVARRELLWSRSAVSQWRTEFLALAAKVR